MGTSVVYCRIVQLYMVSTAPLTALAVFLLQQLTVEGATTCDHQTALDMIALGAVVDIECVRGQV